MSFQADGEDSVSSVDHELTVKELLREILLQLRIMNNYNSIGFDENIREEDLNVD